MIGDNMKKLYEVYTDGACSNNQGEGGQPGGWGVAFVDGRTFSGSAAATTNNRMEMQAAIEALRNTETGSRVKLHSDSAYLINAFTQGWLDRWLLNGWLTAQNKPVENQDLWKQLLELAADREVEWIKVKGHSTDAMNNLADSLAVAAISTPNKKEINPTNSNNRLRVDLLPEELTLLDQLLAEKAAKAPLDEIADVYRRLAEKLKKQSS